jgi:hypothetical protein
MVSRRFYHDATLLNNGQVLLTGGSPDSPNSAELYNPATGVFSSTKTLMNAEREFNPTAVLLNNGKVLIAGKGTAEIYDPATGSFTLTGEQPFDLDLLSVLLTTGKVLVLGDEDQQATGEIYDPASGKFTPTGEFASFASPDENGRNGGMAAVRLKNGLVLIDGGFDWADFPAESVELYDPVAGTFSFTGDTVSYVGNGFGVLLASGKVLLAGGVDHVHGEPTNRAELYDPVTGTFTAASDMTSVRTIPRGTVLLDGRVLVTGGYGADDATALASAELYNSCTASSSTRTHKPTPTSP